MSSFLILYTYKKSLWLCVSILPACGFNLFLLSGVLLKTVKTCSNVIPVVFFLKEVPHGFTLMCNQRQVINQVVFSSAQSVADEVLVDQWGWNWIFIHNHYS